MKFAEKIIWACLLTLVIVFSIGETYILLQNHHQLLQNTIQQNLLSYELESYHLQTNLSQNIYSIRNDQQKIINQATYYLEKEMIHNVFEFGDTEIKEHERLLVLKDIEV